MSRSALAVLSLILGFVSTSPSIAQAANLVRGPYIQNTTTHSGLVVWYNTPATQVAFEYGTSLNYGMTVPLVADTLHAVALQSLQPDQRYYYRILLDGIEVAGGVDYYLETAPLAGSDRAIEFLIWGDSGLGTNKQMTVAAAMNQETPDFAIHVGDIVYVNGERAKYDARYFQPYAPLLQRTAVWPARGNHDRDLNAFNEFWFLPTNSVDSTEMNYTYEYGDIFFLVLDSNGVVPDSILTWADQALSASTHKWKMIYFHHAMYSCGSEHGSNLVEINTFGPIFENNGVDVVFYGHDHHYERSYPMLQGLPVDTGMDPNYINPRAPIYVLSGAAGEARTVNSGCAHAARTITDLVYARARLDNDLLTIDALNIFGDTVDRMTIHKSTLATTSTLDLFNPDGFEVLRAGIPTRIEWSSSSGLDSVAIELSLNGTLGPWQQVSAATANTGSFLWSVPDTSSNNCRLRISDPRNPVILDISEESFTIDNLTPPPSVSLHFSFQPSANATPVGYQEDNGRLLDGIQGFGWSRSVKTNARNSHPSIRYDTYAEVTNPSLARWSVRVPNGAYYVSLVVGDDRFAGTHRIHIEGQRVVNDVSTSAGFFEVFDHLTYVLDGFLSVDVGGIPNSTKKSKICFIDIRSASNAPPPDPNPQPANQPPTVQISATPALGSAPLNVQFQSVATDPENSLLQFSWDFGDGTSGTLASPLHTYLEVGSYSARLWVTDDQGATAADSVVVQVDAAPPSSPAILRVNFSPQTAFLPTGYVIDSGRSYDTTRSYGWNKTQSSRDRSTGDPLIRTHVYVRNSGTADWQVALPNGQYALSLSAGDSDGSAVNRVRIQGNLILDNVSTNDSAFLLVNHLVTVTDGFLHVQAGGAGGIKKTKLNYVDVRRVTNQDPDRPAPEKHPVLSGFEELGSNASSLNTARNSSIASPELIAVNFQPVNNAIPPGYRIDSGRRFDSVRGYGWNYSTMVNTDSPRRNHTDNTYACMFNNGDTRSWTIQVPNGSYLVGLVIGDTNGPSTNRVGVQDELVIDHVVTRNETFSLNHLTRVEDGLLKITIGGIKGSPHKTKLCSLEIQPIHSNIQTPLPMKLQFSLQPNPSNPSTHILLSLPRRGYVQLDIFDVRGRRIRALFAGQARSGEQRILWNGQDDQGQAAPSGLYLVRIATEDMSLVKKLALVR